MEPIAHKTIRVLLVDDDKDDYVIARTLLSKVREAVFVLDWASSYTEGTRQIAEAHHDLYLIDYRLGAETGIELLEHVEPLKRSEPFIILTGAGDDRIEQQAMKLGAADYLVKGTYTSELLSRTLRYALQRKRMEQQRLQHLIDINKAKDEFISLASHQLRTPATAVKQYIGMVLQGYVGDINEGQQGMLQTAYDSNERQLQIVSDLLRVAKVDAGRVKLTKAPTDLDALVRLTVKDLDGKFKALGQTVICETSTEPVMANVDKENIRMVLENLIDNASKYSGKDKTITIRTSTDGDKAIIAIIDQGVGIKAEDTEKLFLKFSRIDNPLSAEVGGTGLGLYWAKRIVGLHRGHITVESIEDNGSTFAVVLPK